MSRRLPAARPPADVAEPRGRLVLRFVGLMWAVELMDVVLGGALDGFGIRPQSLLGLLGIPLAPFLHGGFGHLLANTVPLVILGLLTTARKKVDFLVVFAAATVVGGLGTWLIGAPGTVHIGASGVVFGLLGFLMGRGIWERSASAVLLSVAVTVLYGGMLFGVLPTVGPGISWEGHLFGFIGGLLAARTLGTALQARRRR